MNSKLKLILEDIEKRLLKLESIVKGSVDSPTSSKIDDGTINQPLSQESSEVKDVLTNEDSVQETLPVKIQSKKKKEKEVENDTSI